MGGMGCFAYPTRAALLALVGTLACAAVSYPEETEVTWPGGSGDGKGLLLGPSGAGVHPAAVVLVGPDVTECRDPWAARFASFLVRQGWAVLLPERRGCGVEAAAPALDREELAEEALMALAWLAARPGVDGGRVGLVGLGAGADLAAIVAAKADRVAFVVAAGGGALGRAGFDPMSWWWTVDAPVLFLFGDEDPALVAASRARIEEEMVPENLEVTVRVFAGAGARLTSAGGADAPLRPDVARVLAAWLAERRRD